MGKPKKTISPIKVRRRWKINPQTKLKPSARRYSRQKAKSEADKEIGNAGKKST